MKSVQELGIRDRLPQNIPELEENFNIFKRIEAAISKPYLSENHEWETTPQVLTRFNISNVILGNP